MTRSTRRGFLKRSATAGLGWGLAALLPGGRPAKAAGPGGEIRMGVVGLGGIDVVGGVGGRGRQLIGSLRRIPGVKVVAICDVDQEVLDREVQQFKTRQEEVAACRDLRKVIDDKTVDAVAIATPNHWHALATIWACQAGKDVYVEKPFSYNLWEGRQMVAAAEKYGRMVQVGTQRRSSEVLRQAFDYLHSGQIGAIRSAHALVYRAREGIGRVARPTPVPATVDYDLWCGPAPQAPLMRRQLHYEWHWFWSTGNGEIGNNGTHLIDVCRWALRLDAPPPRALSIGGRFGFDDLGETPNTQIALFDYRPAPIICEIRNLRTANAAGAMGKFRNSDRGAVIECEGGYFAGEMSGGAVFDHQGRQIQEFRDGGKSGDVEIAHLANFLAAVRSRRAGDLNAGAAVGHASTACSHMANLSHRLGKLASPEAVAEANRANPELMDAFERCREYLRDQGVDLGATPAVEGPWLTFDSDRDGFVGEFAREADDLSRRVYREPFVVPQQV
ncbi:MAG: Gfo/Idh/MocA family oxidoreductase [Pirellulales bacterium]|nr:Gfo/Idh/MocA family oxidoreductase [Pirellulales bacterium]